MTRKLLTMGLSVLFVPFLQSCDDRDVARGAVVGAVVGGSIAAIADDDHRRRDRYYSDRYDNYYRYRNRHYRQYWGNRYRNRSYVTIRTGYYNRLGGFYARPFTSDLTPMSNFELTASSVSKSREAKNVANLFSVPKEVGEILSDAKNRAARGDVRGLMAIGIEKRDLSMLANNQRLPASTTNNMARYLGIDEFHAAEIADDLRIEFQSLVAAGRIKVIRN